MSEEAAANVPAEAAPAEAPAEAANDNAAAEAPVAPVAPEVAAENDNAQAPAEGEPAAGGDGDGLDEETLAALAGGDVPDPDEPTVTIGEHSIPLSALTEYLSTDDDLLGKVKRTIKANGEEREVTLAEALEAVPKAEGFHKKLYELNQERQRLNEAATLMEKDTIQALMRSHNLTREQAVDRLATHLHAELEREAMSPEERKAAEERARLEERARIADEYEQRERSRQREAAEAKARETLEPMLNSALEAAGVAPSVYTFGRVGTLLDRAMRDGIITTDLPTEADIRDAAKQVAKETAAERDTYLSGDGDALLERLGPDVARKVAQAYAKQVQARRGSPERPAGAPPKPKRKPEVDPSEMDWHDYLAMKDREMGIQR